MQHDPFSLITGTQSWDRITSIATGILRAAVGLSLKCLKLFLLIGVKMRVPSTPRPFAMEKPAPKSYVKVTSIPGLSHVNHRNEASKLRRTIWWILFVLGLGLTYSQIQIVLHDYFNYPITTTTSLTASKAEDQMFPAVTVCSTTRIACESLFDIMLGCAQGQRQGEAICDDMSVFCQLTWSSGCFGMLAYDNRTDLVDTLHDVACNGEFRGYPGLENPEKVFESAKKFSTDDLLKELNAESRKAIGIQLKDFLLQCKVDLQQCKTIRHYRCEDVFKVGVVNTFANGNCYTLNGHGEMSEHGFHFLQVDMFMNRLYTPFVPDNEYEGVKVVIHDPKSSPLIEEDALSLTPSTATTMALSVTKVKRLQEPFPSKCNKGWDEVDLGVANLVANNTIYSEKHCDRLCLRNGIYNECGCVVCWLDDLNLKEKLNNSRYCIQDEDPICVRYVREHFDRVANCSCGPACKQVKYDWEKSSLKWPSKLGWVFTAKKHNLTYNGQLIDVNTIMSPENFTKVGDEIKSNLLRLVVKFSGEPTTTITETPVYPNPLTLLSTLGGALSIWMGMSFMMIIEGLELIMDLAFSYISGRNNNLLFVST